MNALFFEEFKMKLIGYLGLSLFLSEKSEVLMMATNRIRLDMLQDNNFFVVSLALKAFSEIADKNMTQDLFQYILQLLKSDSKYIKKKAVLSCIKVLQKSPDLIQELEEVLPHLLEEKNHGLLMSSLHLAKIVIKANPKNCRLFKSGLKNIYAVLDELQSESSFNYLVDSINDPILQTTILDFLKEMAINDPSVTNEFTQKILMVYNNIKNNNSSSAFCLLYECARCIMQIESSNSLKKIGIAILGKFLEMQNSNNLYLSLKMLFYASSKFKEEVAKYNDLIQKCVKNTEHSIKRVSIQILKNIVNSQNVDEIFNLILQELKQQKDIKFTRELFQIQLLILEKVPLSLFWFEQKVVQLLECVQYNVNEEDLYNFFDLVQNYKQLQSYFLKKAVLLMANPAQWKNETLLKNCAWIIGEYSYLLEEEPKVNVLSLLQLYRKIKVNHFAQITCLSLLTSLAKIYVSSQDSLVR